MQIVDSNKIFHAISALFRHATVSAYIIKNSPVVSVVLLEEGFIHEKKPK